jgi:hypothetical protein
MVFKTQNRQIFEIRNSGDEMTCGHSTRAKSPNHEWLASPVVEKNEFQDGRTFC